ncbi:RluA family pseudouridine synthase [Bacillus benzoevorans]|uniref:Pseudouridine synthase n=1 Tax=Bacillus benzoevorans TaxID=1456 RepID=A0A7X0HPV1_9BACI|nr:RluA family pseudouridine synthase [Bacillus benzoevorans]MBB6443435.1 23S rRNA pseudouridine1911/1915/1917 synthase [Bacillus benzoevorans]
MIQTKRIDEWFEIIIPEKWEGLTIEELFRSIWQAPKKQTHILRMEKGVLVDGEPANWTKPLQQEAQVRIRFFTEADFGLLPGPFDLSILYEDDHLLVVNKPAGMDTHPNAPDQTNTLANAAAFYLQSKGEFRQIKHVHRLDRDTTGAVLFAKHPFVGSLLDQMLEKREIKRTYLAIVHGILTNLKGTIDEPIGRDRHHPVRRRVSPKGMPAVTHYEVLKIEQRKKSTMIKCQLATGRTHQIRVHLSHIGHPLAGDMLYGGKPVFTRQALHAVKLEFIHPFTEEKITCHAPFLDTPVIFTDIDPNSI